MIHLRISCLKIVFFFGKIYPTFGSSFESSRGFCIELAIVCKSPVASFLIFVNIKIIWETYELIWETLGFTVHQI